MTVKQDALTEALQDTEDLHLQQEISEKINKDTICGVGKGGCFGHCTIVLYDTGPEQKKVDPPPQLPRQQREVEALQIALRKQLIYRMGLP
jgi:isopentenyl phosphate kinase